jgi:hypothetical protein
MKTQPLMKWRQMRFAPFLTIFFLSLAACATAPAVKSRDFGHSNNVKQYISAAERWESLIAENFKSRPIIRQDPGLRYWDQVDGLPNVLIYGDSISISYTATVRSELQGVANVIRLPDNGSHSGEIISKMQEMHSSMRDPHLSDPWDFTWDAIHFNVGLHDFKYVVGGALDKVNGQQVNSVDAYEQNLREAIAYFREIAPEAELIFATTTPVPEGEPGRYVRDALTYNDAALRVVSEYGIAVNDLYTFTLPHLDDWILSKGNVHYKEVGYKAQGIEVARIIKERLETRSDKASSSD